MSTSHVTPPPSGRTRPVHEGPTAGIPPRPRPGRAPHRPGVFAMVMALVMVPVWLLVAGVVGLGQGFCEDAATAETCADQAVGSKWALALIGVAILVLFVVGMVEYSRASTQESSSNERTAPIEPMRAGGEHDDSPTVGGQHD